MVYYLVSIITHRACQFHVLHLPLEALSLNSVNSPPSLQESGHGRVPSEAVAHPISAPVELNGWFFYGAHSLPGSVAPSPTCTPALSEAASTATSSAYWNPEQPATAATTAMATGTGFHGQSRYREVSAGSGMHLDELLESPLLRSRNATGAMARPGANVNVHMPAGLQLHALGLSPRHAQDVGPANLGQGRGRDAPPQIPIPHGYFPFTPVYPQPILSGHPPPAEFVHEYPYMPIPVPMAMPLDSTKADNQHQQHHQQVQQHQPQQQQLTRVSQHRERERTAKSKPKSMPNPNTNANATPPQTPTIFIAETGSGGEKFPSGLARSASMGAVLSMSVDSGTAAGGSKGKARAAGKPKRASSSASVNAGHGAGASTSTRASQRAAARAAK